MNQYSVKQLKRVKTYFKTRFNRELSDAELVEVCDSLYHLGKAIFEYKLLQTDRVQSTKVPASAPSLDGTPIGAPTTVV